MPPDDAAERIVEEVDRDERDATARARDRSDDRTLQSLCACGHARAEHTGLRMEVNGRCLQCDCERFATEDAPQFTDAEILRRISATIERVERMQLMLEAARAKEGMRRNGVHERHRP